MLLTILIIAAVIIVILLVVVTLQPAVFQITRSITVSAPPETVFSQVNDFRQWEAWSPWAKLDPACKNNFSGAASGTGAFFAWAGNKKVGAGRMTIVESQPPGLIRIRLEFLKPFKATNTAEFTFKAAGGQTEVTWSMSGKNNFMGKAFGLLLNCDKMIGGDFEKGLIAMKSVAEGESAK